MRLKFPRKISKKFTNIKFQENSSLAKEAVEWGRTDREKNTIYEADSR